tara:strand:- start:651 stop:1673 length:1023 start_codon:yes stop_codon:yes gene_type:complete
MLNSKDKYNVAVVGATGIVGESLLDIIFTRNFPVKNLHAVASQKSKGSKVKYGNKLLTVEALDEFDFSGVDIAFFSAGGSISKQYVPVATKHNCIVIDNTSEYRYVDNIPLIVPEVNGDEIVKYAATNIIANPNCSTIQMLVALKPIHDLYSIKSINVSTYQAVSGSGKDGVEELLEQSSSYINQRIIDKKVYPKQIAFNVIPFVDSFLENKYTREEMKMVWETQKILDKNISVNPTAVRVPVLVGHAESIYIETNNEIDIQTILSEFEKFKGITVVDDPENLDFPTPFEQGHGTDNVYVGRLRKCLDKKNALNLWVVADNVRKGAALNSIQIAEHLIRS